jgi:hypothetical protein|tara:strand:+ start:74 stop:637 length:564 start_codon:yes stop_codon:yes gene_type:complete
MDNDLQKMFIEDAPQDVDNLTGVNNLSTLVIELQRLEDEIANEEERLKLKKEKADKISNIAIPEIMQALKLKTMKLADGSAIEVKEVYSATIPLDKKEGAFNWLREHGLGDLIKNEVTVSFGRGEDNKAAEYADLARGQGLEPTQKLKVEPMTLKALFRERSENNQELPSEHFNLFKGNKTKITRSK